jgi:hypothetical protein
MYTITIHETREKKMEYFGGFPQSAPSDLTPKKIFEQTVEDLDFNAVLCVINKIVPFEEGPSNK